MAVLSTQDRKDLSKSQFAIPSKAKTPEGKAAGGSYPIPDRSHARNALARVSQFGDAEEKAEVRSAIHRKYPSIGKKMNAVKNKAKQYGAK